MNEGRRERRINRPYYMEWNIQRNNNIGIDNQGHLELACEFCNALYWPKEVNRNGVYTLC